MMMMMIIIIAFEIKKLWKIKRVKVVPIDIAALGTVPKKLEEHLSDVNVGIELAALQKTVLLGSARILRRVISLKSEVACCLLMLGLKDGAYFCYCAYVLRILRHLGFLWVVRTNTGIFLRGFKLFGESRT